MSYDGPPRKCIVCGRDYSNTPFPNKSAVCRYCRKKLEKLYNDRYWDPKRKVWLARRGDYEG